MKAMNRITIVALTTLLVVSTPAARGDTLGLKEFAPITFNDRVDMKYTIESTVVGTLGKFTAAGRSVSVDGVALVPKGTFLLTAYFNPVTGQIIKDHANNTLDPLLDVKDGSANQLYFSRHINRFAYDLSVALPTFDFEFFNEGGSLPALNPLDFIGATLRNATSFTGTKSFISAAPVGTVVFNNNTVMGIEAGTANVFMTPTPTAMGGGLMLLGCIFVGAKLRRQSNSAE